MVILVLLCGILVLRTPLVGAVSVAAASSDVTLQSPGSVAMDAMAHIFCTAEVMRLEPILARAVVVVVVAVLHTSVRVLESARILSKAVTFSFAAAVWFEPRITTLA